MNRYSWSGINIRGEKCRGVLIAHSSEEVKKKLFLEGVAVLSVRKSWLHVDWHLDLYRTNRDHFLQTFFSYLALIMNSGVDISRALILTKEHVSGSRFQSLVHAIQTDVVRGISFSQALGKHPKDFPFYAIQLSKAGEHSGQLIKTFELLSAFVERRAQIIKRIRQAALVPVITLLFALCIVIAVLLFIVPQFEIFFSSFDKPLPESTQFVVNLSRFLQSGNILWIFVVPCLLGFVVRWIYRLKKIQRFKDSFFLKIWYVRKFIILPLIAGLSLARSLISNHTIQTIIYDVEGMIQTGVSFSDALKQRGKGIIPQSIITLLALGEQSGNLVQSLEKSLLIIQRSLDQSLQFFIQLIQHVLMIILGLFVAALLITIYMPIFSLVSFV